MSATWTKEAAIDYKARLAAAREKGYQYPEFHVTIPKPQDVEGHRWNTCNKCGGTGRYCQGMHNGAPASNTGFVCYSCGGTGWKLRKNPRTKEQKAAHEAALRAAADRMRQQLEK